MLGYEGLEYAARQIDTCTMLVYNTLELKEYGPNPVADRSRRSAMTSAIDREALVEALCGDDTFAPAPFNFPDWPHFYEPSIEPTFPYDPKAAERYLAVSGYEGGDNSKLRDELPNGELFYSLAEARIVIESWRRHYNRQRPHSSLCCKPPAPLAVLWPDEPRPSTRAAKPTMH